ncbi:DUF6686 family protein [uncultured Algibacter sp.]|uniref:DUF6686 family protein n=1 Tax=uncultured Algibacter sp. TaxID=298659 RepID=UPI0032176C70
MEDIDIIYKNDLGIAFIWKRCVVDKHRKINLVFNNVALHCTNDELNHFSTLIEESFDRASRCTKCQDIKTCKTILLETPVSQVSFTTNYNELTAIKDLVSGTTFVMGLDTVLKKIL